MSKMITALAAGAMGHIAYMDFALANWPAGIWHAVLAIGLLFVSFIPTPWSARA